MARQNQKITIKDIAAHAGVSLGTVSRVLNGHPSVNRDIVRRVNASMVELEFTPNAAARSMRSNTTRTVAFIVSDISNPLYARIVRTAEQILNDKGYFVLLGNTGNNRDHEIRLVKLFKAGRVDAVLLTVSDEQDPEILEAIRDSSVPIVLLDREIEYDLDAVLSDHRSGMKKAIEYLWRLKHRRIALITGSESERPGRDRLAGFIEGHAELGAKIDPELVKCGSLSEEFGFQEAYGLLAHPKPPTAIIAGGNRLVAGTIRAIRQLRLRIPQDVSLIGCDETELSHLLDPALTVISRDIEAIGRAAGMTLIRRLLGPTELKTTKVVFPTDFIIRGSCADLNAPGHKASHQKKDGPIR